ncbi:MAG: DUF393 domain-containing protein [Candidatus Hinthialibacter antarcticus]|nr:DUF393 domain-containing protein [Candidatus Hinthialibacter antarcticus]
MIWQRDEIYVIYDGECRFCCACVKVFQRLDWTRCFLFVDASDWGRIQKEFPALASFESAEALCVLENNTVHWGFFAVRRMLWKTPLLWPVLVVAYVPGAQWLGPGCYSWFAKNRYRIGCNGSSCK